MELSQNTTPFSCALIFQIIDTIISASYLLFWKIYVVNHLSRNEVYQTLTLLARHTRGNKKTWTGHSIISVSEVGNIYLVVLEGVVLFIIYLSSANADRKIIICIINNVPVDLVGDGFGDPFVAAWISLVGETAFSQSAILLLLLKPLDYHLNIYKLFFFFFSIFNF